MLTFPVIPFYIVKLFEPLQLVRTFRVAGSFYHSSIILNSWTILCSWTILTFSGLIDRLGHFIFMDHFIRLHHFSRLDHFQSVKLIGPFYLYIRLFQPVGSLCRVRPFQRIHNMTINSYCLGYFKTGRSF